MRYKSPLSPHHSHSHTHGHSHSHTHGQFQSSLPYAPQSPSFGASQAQQQQPYRSRSSSTSSSISTVTSSHSRRFTSSRQHFNANGSTITSATYTGSSSDLGNDSTYRHGAKHSTGTFGPTGEYIPNNIYIRGLPEDYTDDMLLAQCKEFGKIISSKAIIDPMTGKCKGYGFVMFNTVDEAKSAMLALGELGYQVSYARAGPKTINEDRLREYQDPESTNVYMANLPISMTENDLMELLKPFGIEGCKILTDGGVSRGVGFAKYA
eukprot:jgi/Hompol1/2960/HPOL_006252-RA